MDVQPNTSMLQEEELQLALLNLQNYAPTLQANSATGAPIKMEVPNGSQMEVEQLPPELSLQYSALLNQLSFPQQLQEQQFQLQQAQLHQAQLQQAQLQQAQLQQAQIQQLMQGPPPEPQVNIPPPHAVEGAAKVIDNSVVPPPEFRQFVYAIAPPLYVYPSMYNSMMYPMMMHESTFSMGVSSSPPYHGGTPLKSRKLIKSSDSDSSRKKQTRKTLWIPLSVENVFLNWFEKIGSTQYRCKRDACVGLIEAIADAGDIDDWIPDAQRAFNDDSKRKGRDLIWDKLNEMGKTFCDEKRTWSLTFSAAVLKYCLPKETLQ